MCVCYGVCENGVGDKRINCYAIVVHVQLIIT